MLYTLDRIKIGLSVALLAVLTGCVGYVDGGAYYGGEVVVPGPDLYIYGGGFEHERGHDVHSYSQRGYTSREVAHPGGGGHPSGGGHPGGGGGHPSGNSGHGGGKDKR